MPNPFLESSFLSVIEKKEVKVKIKSKNFLFKLLLYILMQKYLYKPEWILNSNKKRRELSNDI